MSWCYIDLDIGPCIHFCFKLQPNSFIFIPWWHFNQNKNKKPMTVGRLASAAMLFAKFHADTTKSRPDCWMPLLEYYHSHLSALFQALGHIDLIPWWNFGHVPSLSIDWLFFLSLNWPSVTIKFCNPATCNCCTNEPPLLIDIALGVIKINNLI